MQVNLRTGSAIKPMLQGDAAGLSNEQELSALLAGNDPFKMPFNLNKMWTYNASGVSIALTDPPEPKEPKEPKEPAEKPAWGCSRIEVEVHSTPPGIDVKGTLEPKAPKDTGK